MNLLELLESYQFLLSGHGREYADNWLKTVGTNFHLRIHVAACFTDDGEAKTLSLGTKTFTFYG